MPTYPKAVIGRLLLLLFSATTITTTTGRDITAIPSSGNFVLYEELTESVGIGVNVQVSSDVPVTIHKYSDSTFTEGQQPVLYNQAKVTITSNCDTWETSSIPQVEWEESTSTLNVNLGVSEEDGSSMGFLASSAYEAVWSWVNYFCQNPPPFFGSSTVGPTVSIDGGGNGNVGEGEGLVDGIPTKPVLGSTDMIGTIWPSGEELVDYANCGYDCCSSDYCVDMVDTFGVNIGGCCDEGKCRVKFSSDEQCFDVGPPADVICGYDAWLAWQSDGNCPLSGIPTTTPQSIVGGTTTSSSTSSTVEMDPTTASTSTTSSTTSFTTTTSSSTTFTTTVTTTPASDTTEASSSSSSSTGATTTAQASTSSTSASPGNTQYKCSNDFCEGNLTDEYFFRYKVNSAEGTITMELTYDGVAWVAFALSRDGNMIGGEAVIGIPGAVIPVQKYNLGGKSTGSVLPMDDAQQTLIDPSVEIVGGQTILRFTKLIKESNGDEIEISPEGNFFLWAYGSSTTLGYHASRRAFSANLLEVEEAGDAPTTGAPNTTTETTSTMNASTTSSSTSTSTSSSTTTELPTTTDAATTSTTTQAATTVKATVGLNELTSTSSTKASSTTQIAPTEKTTTSSSTTRDDIMMDTSSSSSTVVTTTKATTQTTTSTSSVQSTGTATTESSTSSSEANQGLDFPTASPVIETDKPTFNFDANLTSKAPTESNGDRPTNKPTFWWEATQGDVSRVGENNAAFPLRGRTMFSFQLMMTTVLALILVSYILPGRDGVGISSFGKFALAAAVVSSVYKKSSGNIRRNDVQNTFSAKSRDLQTCIYNVEILLDTCSNTVDISAPSARMIDVVIENLNRETNSDDECQTDLTAELTFPDSNAMQVGGTAADGTVMIPQVPADSNLCFRPMEGRPFVDESGSILMALPMVVSDGASAGTTSWTMSLDNCNAMSTQNSNTTIQRHYQLGEDWIQRALGEHSSVASFSAFSISLMTNNAPSTLVEDALNAGLDEIRHARVSFEIASKFAGREVGPGPLPPSKHDFDQDLISLAKAVAKEGCIDETLSAFAAAMEVAEIAEVLESSKKDSKYSNVDIETLGWIEDELRAIAVDESGHSALAWRTMIWVCSVDADACDAVQKDVFNESILNAAIQRRFGGAFYNESGLDDIVGGEWEKIYTGLNRLKGLAGDREMICTNGDADGHSNNGLFLSYLTDRVLRGVLCA